MSSASAPAPKAAPKVRLMSGNEAIAHGALVAGCDFYAGYPITPSTEIFEELSRHLPKRGGAYVQMEDEIGAMAAIVGAALAGARALTATSGPGFSLKQENIGFAIMAEVPCVIVNVMRGGPSTGLPTHSAQGDVMQARWGTHGDHAMLALAPATVVEAFELTVEAFRLAESLRTPVMILIDEVLGHGSERALLPDLGPDPVAGRKRPTVPPEQYLPYENTADEVPAMADFGRGYRWHVTGLSHDESGFPSNKPDVVEKLHRRLISKIERDPGAFPRPEVLGPTDAALAVIAYGSTARSAKRAIAILAERGHAIRLVRPRTLWPFDDTWARDAGEHAQAVAVIEMNAGQYAGEIERAIAGRAPVRRIGRLNGELLTPDELVERLLQVTDAQGKEVLHHV